MESLTTGDIETMSKEKWKAEYDYLDVGGWAVFEDTEEQAVECISADLTKSRAHLIAAAPDLLSALEEMVAAVTQDGEWDDGCFYFEGKSAPRLGSSLQPAMDALEKSKPNTP